MPAGNNFEDSFKNETMTSLPIPPLNAGESSEGGSSSPKLLFGSSSRLGPRSSNEDRCISCLDLHFEVDNFMCSSTPSNHIPFYGGDRGPKWKELSTPQRICGSNVAGKDSYFAIYDGHSGSTASNFLNNVLHHSIYR